MKEVLPRYTFTGPTQDPETVAAATYHLDTLKASLPPEIIKSPEQVQHIEAIQGAIETFGGDLGLDLSRRTIPVDYVHFFTPEEFDKIRKRYGKDDEWHGGQLSTGEVIVDGDPESPTAWSQLNHELLHGYSHAPRRINGGDIDTARRGYAVKGAGGAFHVLDEVVVEKMNQHIQNTYWHGPLEALKGGDKGYATATPVIENLVQAVASDGQESEKALWMELFKSELRGDVAVLRKLYTSIGTEGMRILADYRESNATNAAKVAEGLGSIILKHHRKD